MSNHDSFQATVGFRSAAFRGLQSSGFKGVQSCRGLGLADLGFRG